MVHGHDEGDWSFKSEENLFDNFIGYFWQTAYFDQTWEAQI